MSERTISEPTTMPTITGHLLERAMLAVVCMCIVLSA